jgi:hypothetical protein
MDPSAHHADNHRQHQQIKSEEPKKRLKKPHRRRTKTEQGRQENANETAPMTP